MDYPNSLYYPYDSKAIFIFNFIQFILGNEDQWNDLKYQHLINLISYIHDRRYILDYSLILQYSSLPNKCKRHINTIQSHPINFSFPSFPIPMSIRITKCTNIHIITIFRIHLILLTWLQFILLQTSLQILQEEDLEFEYYHQFHLLPNSMNSYNNISNTYYRNKCKDTTCIIHVKLPHLYYHQFEYGQIELFYGFWRNLYEGVFFLEFVIQILLHIPIYNQINI